MRSIRPALADDAVAIADVHIASWRAGYKDILSEDLLDEVLDRANLERMWASLIASPDPPGSRILLVCDRETVVGYSRFGSSRDMDSILQGGVGEIYGFYLHPNHWSRGLGRDLMRAVVAVLSEQGYLHATLNVIESNDRARSFYERQGWLVDIEAAPWYGLPQVRYRIEL